MITKIQNWLLFLRLNPVLLTVFILFSMCFCFIVAEYSGSIGQWSLAMLGVIILALSYKNAPDDWKVQAFVSFALAIPTEYFLSIYLHWYSYAWGAVPPWVYAGHSIVHFGALVLAAFILRNKYFNKWFIRIVLGLTLAYGLASFVFANDLVGLVCSLIMLVIIGKKSKYQTFFACFSIYVVWLEFWGVYFAQWHWAPYIFGNIQQANPPANIVAGYCALAWATTIVSEKIVDYSRKRQELYSSASAMD